MYEHQTVFTRGWEKVKNSPIRLKPLRLQPATQECYRALRCALYDGGCTTLDYATWQLIHNGQPVQLKLF